MELDRFNIRVYAVVLKENHLMVLKEKYAGETLIKLPGGGLELGESVTECLHREFLEELNLKIKIKSHFYTQDTFLKSRFCPNEQLICIYYLVDLLEETSLQLIDEGIDEVLWLNIWDKKTVLPLPIDSIVLKQLQKSK